MRIFGTRTAILLTVCFPRKKDNAAKLQDMDVLRDDVQPEMRYRQDV